MNEVVMPAAALTAAIARQRNAVQHGRGDQNFPFCKIVGGGYANNADCGA
jgi:hypothetical protein